MKNIFKKVNNFQLFVVVLYRFHVQNYGIEHLNEDLLPSEGGLFCKKKFVNY
jgi:hypothetical protein